MVKIIELTRSGVGRLAEREPFLLPDELELEFTTNGYNLSNAFITLHNGDKTIYKKLTNPFKVDNTLLFGGVLSGKIKAYIGKVVVKSWDILPLVLTETESDTQVKDYIKILEDRVVDLEKDVATLKKQHEIIK